MSPEENCRAFRKFHKKLEKEESTLPFNIEYLNVLAIVWAGKR